MDIKESVDEAVRKVEIRALSGDDAARTGTDPLWNKSDLWSKSEEPRNPARERWISGSLPPSARITSIILKLRYNLILFSRFFMKCSLAEGIDMKVSI